MIKANLGKGDPKKVVSFHPDSNWFAVYACEDDAKPYLCERLAGWALCEFEEGGGQLIGILPALQDDYQFAADDADNFLGYMYGDEPASKFDVMRTCYLERERKARK